MSRNLPLALLLLILGQLIPTPLSFLTRIELDELTVENPIFGSVVIFRQVPEVENLTLNNRKPYLFKSPKDGGQYWIFALGFEQRLRVKGTFNKQNWFEFQADVKNPDLSKALDLSLPSKVSKRLKLVRKEQRKHEAEVMRAIVSKQNGPIGDLCFQLPIDQIMTSPYGRPRKLATGVYYFHQGTDLLARTGDPLLAAGDGVISMATERGVAGNTVVIDHGGGLYTKYSHLSKFLTKRGQKVTQGQPIGLAGATGRVTGAHLHWEVTLQGINVDPLRFMKSLRPHCLTE